MKKPDMIDYKEIKTSRLKRRSIIPFMQGRPARNTIIQKDDIINLIIMLNTCKSLNEFLNKV
ncbi:MAG: hypothetical protein PVI26_09950 [Chitinispirillia bacterium]|jgi:hypothetical protein